VIVGLVLHILFTTFALCYLSKQLRAHGLAIVALAKALTLTIEAKKRLESREDERWN
jgi:hypothetical protein